MHTLTYISFIQTTSMLKYYHICSLPFLDHSPLPLLNICLCPKNLEDYFSKFFDKWIEATFFNGNPLQYSCLENPRDRGA